MKIHVYRNNRAESFIDPLISRLKRIGWWEPEWPAADLSVIASDRKEAMRFGMTLYEAGRPFLYWGANDECPGDAWHYDGQYRKMLAEIANDSFAMNNSPGSLGPPHIDGVVVTDKPDAKYALLCMNPLPWAREIVPAAPTDMHGWAMFPGLDEGWDVLLRDIRVRGWTLLDPMPRKEFLRILAGAQQVIGNSSLLSYEAPLFHADDHIIRCGLRNKGRPIVRWDVAKQGSPCDNMMRVIQEAFDDMCDSD